MGDMQFIGHIEEGDEYRIEEAMNPGAIYIGGQDVVRMLDIHHFHGKEVRVSLHRGTDDWELEFSGFMRVSQGYGDMEGNPWAPDELFVGTENVLTYLTERSGEHALLQVFVL